MRMLLLSGGLSLAFFILVTTVGELEGSIQFPLFAVLIVSMLLVVLGQRWARWIVCGILGWFFVASLTVGPIMAVLGLLWLWTAVVFFRYDEKRVVETTSEAD